VKISGIIITRNEADQITAAVENLKQVCDEVLVVDSGSDDDTVSLAQAAGARTHIRDWTGFVDQRNAAAGMAAHDWVLFLDADERLSDRLVGILHHLKGQEGEPVAPGMAFRRNIRFMGKAFRNSPLTCEWKVRLYDRRRGHWVGGSVHERVEVTGRVVRVPAFVDHFAYDDAADAMERFRQYAYLRASDHFMEGRRTGLFRMAFSIKLTFLKKYLLEMKFLKGTPGLMLACLESSYTALKYMRLYELQQTEQKGEKDEQ